MTLHTDKNVFNVINVLVQSCKDKNTSTPSHNTSIQQNELESDILIQRRQNAFPFKKILMDRINSICIKCKMPRGTKTCFCDSPYSGMYEVNHNFIIFIHELDS